MYETQRQDKAGQVSGEVAGTGKEDCGEGIANGPICKTHDETQQCNTVVCTDCGIDIEAAFSRLLTALRDELRDCRLKKGGENNDRRTGF